MKLLTRKVFVTAAQFGSFFSGVMQGSIQKTMHGRSGFAGWKWLFIIDFAITVPVALYGYFMFPDTPHTTKAFWLSEEERQLCLKRLPPTEHYVITWPRFRASCIKIVTTWRFYLFSALFMLSATSFEKVGVYSECLLWLKSIQWNPVTLNYLGLTPIASAILGESLEAKARGVRKLTSAGTYILTVYCDATGHRFWANVIMYISVLISSIMILVWDISTGAKFFAYIIAGEFETWKLKKTEEETGGENGDFWRNGATAMCHWSTGLCCHAATAWGGVARKARMTGHGEGDALGRSVCASVRPCAPCASVHSESLSLGHRAPPTAHQLPLSVPSDCSGSAVLR